jgi:hypothetical protein
MNRLRALLITLALACALSPPALAQTSINQAGGIGNGGTDCSTAINCVILQISPGSLGSASIWVTGTWSATLQFEVTSDIIASGSTNTQLNALTWVSVNAFPSTSTTGASNTTTNGLWVLNAANITGLRVRASTYASGLVNVTLRASTASARNNGGGSGSGVGIYTVATLPSGLGAGGTGTLDTVKDGSTASDCTVGGGSNAVACIWTGAAWAFAGSSAAAPAFSAITSATNTSATMTCGAGCTMTTTSTGVNNANEVNGGTVPASAPLVGTNSSKQPISVTTIPTSTVPAFTGDMTNTAGSLATTVGQVNGAALPASATFAGTNGSNQVIATACTSADLVVGNASNKPACVALTGDSTLTNAGLMTNTALNGGSVPASAKVLGTNGSSQPIAAALTSAHLYVGNASNLPADVALTGDSTLTNAGLMTNTAINGGAFPTSASVIGSNGSAQPVTATAHGIQAPQDCNDASGSGTAQTCSTTVTFTLGQKDCVNYTPGTTNTGDVTLAVNSGTAYHFYKWGGSSTLASGDLVAGVTQVVCLDSSNRFELPTVGNPPASGATINNQNQYGAPYYSTSGSNNTLSGIAPPTTQGYFNQDWVNTTNAASAPQVVQVGLTGRSLTGSATTCGGSGVLYSDVASWIDHDQAATGTVNCSLPTPATLNNTSFAFRYTNHSAQTDTITPAGGYTIQLGSGAAASTLSVASGVGCGIIVDPNSASNWLADCSNINGTTGTGTVTHSVGALTPLYAPVIANGGADVQSTGGGYIMLPPLTSGSDVCGPLNTALLAAQTAGVVTPKIDLSGIGPNVICTSDPFVGFTSVNGAEIDIGGGTISTNVPIGLPYRVSLHGTFGSGSSINASTTFHTNYPTIVGTTASNDTICFSNGNTTVISGTNVSGTCTAGGIASFAGVLPHYVLLMCPGTTPACNPGNTLAVGIVQSVSSTTAGNSSLTLQLGPSGSLTIPTSGTGYHYAFVAPLFFTSYQNQSGGLITTNYQELEHVSLGVNDSTSGVTDCHFGYFNMTGQEGVWMNDVKITDSCWAYVGQFEPGENSGPHRNLYLLSTKGYSSSIGGVGIVARVATWHGVQDSTINIRNSTSETAVTGILAANGYNAHAGTLPNYGPAQYIRNHIEIAGAGDAIQIGDALVWPWAANGEGLSAVSFANNSGGPSNAGNLYHVMNATGASGSYNVIIDNSATEDVNAQSNCIKDDVNTLNYANCPVHWAGPAQVASAPDIIDGGVTAFGPLDIGTVGTAGVLGLVGSTSGIATCTAPAVAGTSTNAVVCTNNLQAPALVSTVAIGTAPLTVTSTTVVPNLNVSQLLGKTWAVPSTIGSTTPNTGAFTTLSASGQASATAAGAASTPGLLVSGAPYTGGSSSTTQPQVYVSSGGSVTGFSTAGTVFGMNAPSGFTGNLIDSFVNGGASHLFTVNYQGNITAGSLAENLLAGASAAATITEGGSTFSVTRAGVSTANLTYPWVFTNANSTNNNTSGVVGFSASGSSTGQTVMNLNQATTGGDILDWGTGGSYSAGVLSGQTISGSILENGSIQTKGTTAGFVAMSQGSTSSGVAPCNAATTICFQAPTSVTSQLRVLAGAPATGFPLYTNSSGTMTETISATSGTLSSGVGVLGTLAVNAVLASTVANAAGHFTNLQVVTSLGGTCSTVPIFNVFDGTTNTGSTVTATSSTQTKGTGTSTAQTLTFAAGDVIGIYISTAGATCTLDQFVVSAQYSIP